jgi:hypothetical protein
MFRARCARNTSRVKNKNKYIVKNSASRWSFTKNQNMMHGQQNVIFSLLFYAITNFRKSRGQPGHLAPHWRPVSPLNTGKDDEVTHWYFDSASWRMFMYQILYSTVIYVNERLQDCHLPTKIYVICPPCVLKNPLKWHALTPTSELPSTHTKVSQEETRTKTLMELSPPPTLLNSGPSRVTRSLRGEVFTSSPIIRNMKQKAKRMNNNFKETGHDPNSSNSNKNHDSDCCRNVRNITT